MDEGLAPVALAAEDRVAQPEVDAGLRKAGGVGLGDGAGQGFVAGQAVPVAAVAEHGPLVRLSAGFNVVPFEDGRNGQVEVALANSQSRWSPAGTGHDGARAVAGQDVVGNPDGHGAPGRGVHRMGAGEEHPVLRGRRPCAPARCGRRSPVGRPTRRRVGPLW